MSDYNVLIKKQSMIYLGGPPLVKMATGEETDHETLGGAQMHTDTSGTRRIPGRRRARCHSPLPRDRLAPEPFAKARTTADAFVAEEPVHGFRKNCWASWIPTCDSPLDIREVIGRVVDGSRFEEFKPRYGTTLVCGWASIHGYLSW